MTRARALTLVELLAASVILAAAGGAMASVLRDASSAARRARLQRDALLAYEAWRSADSRGHADASGGPWEWRDPRGVLWRVTMTSDPAPPESDDEAVALEWGAVVVEAWREALSAGGAFEVVFTAPRVRRVAPAEAIAP